MFSIKMNEIYVNMKLLGFVAYHRYRMWQYMCPNI